MVDNAINETLNIVNSFVGFYQLSQGVPATTPGGNSTNPGQVIYGTPAPILVPMRVTFEGVDLKKDSFTNLLLGRPDLLNQTTPAYGTPMFWSPIGLNLFCISPSDGVGGGYLEVTGVAEVPKLVNATDVVVLDDEYSELVEVGAFLRLVLIEGGKVFSDAYQANYKPWLKKLRSLSRWILDTDPKREARQKVEAA